MNEIKNKTINGEINLDLSTDDVVTISNIIFGKNCVFKFGDKNDDKEYVIDLIKSYKKAMIHIKLVDKIDKDKSDNKLPKVKKQHNKQYTQDEIEKILQGNIEFKELVDYANTLDKEKATEFNDLVNQILIKELKKHLKESE